jgi:molybdate transport system permease protein
MSKRSNVEQRYNKSFDRLIAIPLWGYLLIIIALLVGMVARLEMSAVREAFQDKDLLYAIKLSIITSFASTFLSVLVAVPAGYMLSRSRIFGISVIDTILDIPIVLPPLVMGLSVLIFFNTPIGRFLDRGIVEEGIFVYQPLGIVLVQFIVGCAFAIRVLKSGFDNIDPRFEHMAMTLGAGRWQCFFKVIIPNALPSIIAGSVISWARIFGLFGPVLLIAGTMRGRTEIMPTTVFLEISIGRIEVALVVGVLMIVFSLSTLILFKKLGGKGYLW